MYLYERVLIITIVLLHMMYMWVHSLTNELCSVLKSINSLSGCLWQEKAELHEKLQESEKKLLESQSSVTSSQNKALMEVEEQQALV